jgi:hypothetical protein
MPPNRRLLYQAEPLHATPKCNFSRAGGFPKALEGPRTSTPHVYSVRRRFSAPAHSTREARLPAQQGVQREQGPPGCRLDVAKGGLSRAARSKRGEAGSQFGRNHHGGALGGQWYLVGGTQKTLDLQIGRGGT